jgi:hypothetical protein
VSGVAAQLPAEDVLIESGRATGGRMFIRVTHTPTGKSRTIVGLDGRPYGEVVQQLQDELATEVLSSETSPARDDGANNESE